MNKYIAINSIKYVYPRYRGGINRRSIFSTWDKTTDILCKENEEFMTDFFSNNPNDEWTSDEKQICRSSFSKYRFECTD